MLVLITILMFLLPSSSLFQPPINPSKIGTNLNKMKKAITRNENKVVSVAPKQPRPESSDRITRDMYGLPVIEMFVRRSGTGILWTRYEDSLCDDSTKDIVKNIESGGLLAELRRTELDNILALKVFGKGIGSAAELPLINKVKSLLPSFRKLKPKDFEFGYRVAVEGEAITVLNRAMTRLPDVQVTEYIPAVPIDFNKIIQNSTEILGDSRALINSLKSNISSFVDELCKYNENEVMKINVFTDGSALIYGKNCIYASAGIFITAPSSKSGDGSSGYRCLNVNVQECGGLVQTPFDAELCAGLFGVLISKLLIRCINSNSTKFAIKTSFYTDSKTLVKAVRDGPPTSTQDLPENRISLWSRLADEIKLLESHVSNEKVENNIVQWIPGHPERREQNCSKWNEYDNGIFAADTLAKGDDLTTTITKYELSTNHTSSFNDFVIFGSNSISATELIALLVGVP